MSHTACLRSAFLAGLVAFVSVPGLRADDTLGLTEQLRELRRQNQALQEQLTRQQSLIESLTERVNSLQQTGAQNGQRLDDLAGEMRRDATVEKSEFGPGRVRLSGEGGVMFLQTGSEGAYPQSTFRVDEARLFLEAQLWKNAYFYSELTLVTREEPDVQVRLGELYVDFENISALWDVDHLLNARVGRMYTPFGEEYLYRYAIDNPLVSRSLPDLWAVDEGIELYGRLGKFNYAAAVQNGGLPDTQDFTSDKAVAGRIGYDPAPWLHLSASGMRTGDLAINGDLFSAMWFANGFFRSLGSPATTRFHADLAEGDVELRFPHTRVRAFGGYIHYDDNDPAGSNQRDVYYYSAELVQDITKKLYAAARFSQVLAADGFPVIGNGTFGNNFFGALTEELWRLSLGAGYRWNQNLLTKAEYTFERGKETGGATRNHEDLFAVEVAFKF